MEETLHKKRNDFISIIDINVDFLSKIDYTKIMEVGQYSLEKLLYIFICDKKEMLDADFDTDLYYNKEEIINQYSFDQGVEQGIAQATQQTKRDIAVSMLKDKVSLETIVKYTGLTKEELDSLK